ncbi:hypothetical protein D1872_130160 [compost metagenome]
MLLAPKTRLTKGSLGGKPFQFNPEAFHDTINVTYNVLTPAGISYPLLSYAGGEQREISFTLYLNDRFERGITKSYIGHLNKFIPKANTKGSNRFLAPKPIKFVYGWFVKECYITGMDTDYTEFSPTLEPWAAAVTLRLLIPQ